MKPSDTAGLFAKRYPTTFARARADAAFDKLPLGTTLGEAIRLWEKTYLEAGGVVLGGEGISAR